MNSGTEPQDECQIPKQREDGVWRLHVPLGTKWIGNISDIYVPKEPHDLSKSIEIRTCAYHIQAIVTEYNHRAVTGQSKISVFILH